MALWLASISLKLVCLQLAFSYGNEMRCYLKSLQSADHRQQTLFHMLLASFYLIEADMFSLHYYATM